jgi:hypothetical protein
MKNIIKIIMIFILAFIMLGVFKINAWVIDLSSWDTILNNTSINIDTNWTITENVSNLWFKILTTIKYIISWILVIFLVYAWAEMIMSMWNNEERLNSAKKQLRYTLVWLIFINIPWTIYDMFNGTKENIWSIWWTWSSDTTNNIFANLGLFNTTFNNWIIDFIEVTIVAIAVFMIILAGIQIMTSRWKDEKITEWKNKIVWSLVWLIFVGFIETWQSLVYSGNISDWASMFETIEELALFFAWPIGIFFLTLAWYYYITSNGDEEKVKKAKSIIINTLIATVILLASHSMLKELSDLSI